MFSLDGTEQDEFDHGEYAVRKARGRFDARIRVDGNGCWVWADKKDHQGYGKILFRGKMVSAHRWSYRYFRGEVPDGLQLDHLCRVRACCNPWHLEAVTARTNVMRGDTIPARNWNKKVCLRGHEFTSIARAEKNGHVYYSRRCQTCVREARQERDRIYGRSSRT